MSQEDMVDFRKRIDHIDMPAMTCRPIKKKTEDESIHDLWKLAQDPNKCILGLYIQQQTPELIGRISLFDFNPRNKSAELGYWLLDEYVGHGYMSFALKFLCSSLLNNSLILNKIYAQTAEFNTRSVKMLETIGFCKDGVLREHHEKNGILYADYIYSLTTNDINNICITYRNNQ